MAGGGFTDESVQRVLGNLKRASAGVIAEVRNGVEELQNEAVAHAKDNHWARHYPNTHGKVVVEPSMSGANRQWNVLMRFPRYGDTNELLTGSIRPERLVFRGGILLGMIGAGMPYAADVEYGTSKSVPHPFMRPALRHARNVDRREKIMQKAVARGLRKGRDRG